MLVVGLTGGIASGKSTVAAMLRDLGAPVVDADQIARQVVEPGTPALAEIAARWPDVLDGDGRLDRKRMADRVFADPEIRAALNGITHPRIAMASAEALAALAGAGQPIAIYEAALLVENKIHQRPGFLGGLVVVAAQDDVQLDRLRFRDGLDEDQARARLAAQLPLAEKLAVADWVVDNGGSLAQTRAQVERIWREIQARARDGG